MQYQNRAPPDNMQSHTPRLSPAHVISFVALQNIEKHAYFTPLHDTSVDCCHEILREWENGNDKTSVSGNDKMNVNGNDEMGDNIR